MSKNKVKYKATFQDIWLEDERFKPWLVKLDDRNTARCKVCCKNISIGTHGVAALTLHADGAKHKERLPKDGISIFFKKANNSEPSETSKQRNSETLKQSTISACTSNSLITNAEIMWALDVVMSNYSFNSSSNKNELFNAMFPDSAIAKGFSCGRTKCSYLVTYGIASYFVQLLNDQLKELEHFVALFDESYNKVVKRSQMDLHVRFWDLSSDIVATRYYSSEFLGKTSAEDICSKFEQCLGSLEREKLIQVSSDGPNVNLLFLKNLAEKRSDDDLSELINLCTCGLHTAHNAFKHGEKLSGWKMKKLMSSLYKIFHEAPGRREDYRKVTDSSDQDFPMQFVSHRWAENEPVARKARLIWPKIIEIIKYWQSLPKRKQPGQGKQGQNTSYDHLVTAVKDPIITVKMLFFEEIARKLNEFLVVFQTNKPMAPFLTETLEALIRDFMEKFMLRSVMDKATTCLSLTKIDLHDVSKQKPAASVDLGFAVKNDIQFLKKNKKITDSQILNFKKEAVLFLVQICSHMIEKSPLTSHIARCLRCLSPTYLAECPEACEILFDKILTKLISYKRITSAVADQSKSGYRKFIKTSVKEKKSEFVNYDKTEQRLDKFYINCIPSSKEFDEMCKIFKMLLILSHGQAQVERGFSTNAKLLVENQSTESLVAQRVIHDHMVYNELQPHTLPITSKLLVHVRQARANYFTKQHERSLKKIESERDLKLKHTNEEITSINQNIKQLQETIHSMKMTADEYAIKAEQAQNFKETKNLISKCNALKRGASEKQTHLDGLLIKKQALIKSKDEM